MSRMDVTRSHHGASGTGLRRQQLCDAERPPAVGAVLRDERRDVCHRLLAEQRGVAVGSLVVGREWHAALRVVPCKS